MERKKNHTGWLAAASFLLGGALLGISTAILMVFVALMLSSCATQKEVEEHHTVVITADTLAMETVADSRMVVVRNYADSLFYSLHQQFSMELYHSSHEQEVTTETITTAIDSLGRSLRTEQRTTTRTASHEEQQRVEQMLTDLRREFSDSMSAATAAWHAELSAVKAHYADSLDVLRHEVQQPAAAAPWYVRLWLRLKGFLAAVAIVAVLYVTRRWWLPIIKH